MKQTPADLPSRGALNMGLFERGPRGMLHPVQGMGWTRDVCVAAVQLLMSARALATQKLVDSDAQWLRKCLQREMPTLKTALTSESDATYGQGRLLEGHSLESLSGTFAFPFWAPDESGSASVMMICDCSGRKDSEWTVRRAELTDYVTFNARTGVAQTAPRGPEMLTPEGEAKIEGILRSFCVGIASGSEHAQSLLIALKQIFGQSVIHAVCWRLFVTLEANASRGKSMLLKMLKAALGALCVEPSNSSLTASSDETKPVPELLEMNNCRLAVLDEIPSLSHTIVNKLVDTNTQGIKARGMRENRMEMVRMAGMVLIGRNPGKSLTGGQVGLIARAVTLKFEREFVDPADYSGTKKDEDVQWPRDATLLSWVEENSGQVLSYMIKCAKEHVMVFDPEEKGGLPRETTFQPFNTGASADRHENPVLEALVATCEPGGPEDSVKLTEVLMCLHEATNNKHCDEYGRSRTTAVFREAVEKALPELQKALASEKALRVGTPPRRTDGRGLSVIGVQSKSAVM